MIVGLVAMYMPTHDEMNNVRKYINKLDYCFLLDDSAVDNSSVVASLINDFPGKVEYYFNPTNIGLCASINNGFKMAIKKGADWVLIMNPDGTFQDGAVDVFRDYIENNDTNNTGIVAPRFNIDRRKKIAGEGNIDIKYPDMTGCLYNTRILEKLGFYDQNTFFYGLDVEYCVRVRTNGYRIVECCGAVLNHQPGETFDVKFFGKTIFKCGKDNPQRYYYQFRSAYYITHKYHDFSCYKYHFVIFTYKLIKAMLFFSNRREYLKNIKYGIQDAKRGFYGNIKDREQNK